MIVNLLQNELPLDTFPDLRPDPGYCWTRKRPVDGGFGYFRIGLARFSADTTYMVNE
jgi:hypothetical protein